MQHSSSGGKQGLRDLGLGFDDCFCRGFGLSVCGSGFGGLRCWGYDPFIVDVGGFWIESSPLVQVLFGHSGD